MAENKSSKKTEVKKPKVAKKTQTVRERAEKAQNKQPRRIKSTAGKVVSPLKRVKKLGKREYHLPLPNNKVGRFLGKRGKIVPKYFRDAWKEIRQVTWPTRSETLRLTLAVFIFSVIFAVFVGLLDYGLDKLFRHLIIKK